MSFLENFFLAFMPIFVAIDAIGLAPMIISLTAGLEGKQYKKLIRDATLAALILAIVFVFGGRALFSLLGITADDFRIGGGIVLFLIAVSDLVFSQQQQGRQGPPGEIGIVPLGIPLILGPGCMTTILILVDKFGYCITILSLIVNLFLAWLVLRHANLLIKLMGNAGANAFAKVASLFLVAIAIMMIRIGITNTFIH